MSKKKKTNRHLGSRFKRMKQPGRLQSAKNWLPTYKGKNILQGYRKQKEKKEDRKAGEV